MADYQASQKSLNSNCYKKYMPKNNEDNESYNRHYTAKHIYNSNWKNSRNTERDKKQRYHMPRNENKTFLTVSSHKVGKIIGKHGVKIKELQDSTGTQITIEKEDSYGQTKVIITGPTESCEKCKDLIEKLVTKNSLNALTTTSTTTTTTTTEIVDKNSFPIIDWDEVNRKADEFEATKWLKCPSLKKDFYFEDPKIASMNEEEVKNFHYSLNKMTVKNILGCKKKIPNPVETFEQAFAKYPEILVEIKKRGFDKPFPIQSQAWPILLSGRDMIGIAQTGTGKTLAFLLPALIHTDGQEVPFSERGGANVLILAPTRELALQIENEVEKYSYRNIKSICVYGGGNRREQINKITSGVQIIIATPGRLNDLIEADVININSVTYLVLDEADRMLDMGFEPQIRKILLDIRPDRQTIMTSATWSYMVQLLAEKYMTEPIQVIIGSLDLAAVHSVQQHIIILSEEEKEEHLMKFISNLTQNDKAMIFVDRKVMADKLSCDLVLQNIDCQCIHGDREQEDRVQAIEDLKSGSVRILIATDVASRGIDITDVTKVLNYDFPRNIEEYVHRVGRTGRAGKTGEAVTFFTRNDWAHAKDLIPILEEANQVVPEELHKMKKRYQGMQERKKNEKLSERGSNRNQDYDRKWSNDNRKFQGRRSKW